MPKEHTIVKRGANKIPQGTYSVINPDSPEGAALRVAGGKIKELQRKQKHLAGQLRLAEERRRQVCAERLADHCALWNAPLWSRLKYAVTGNPAHIGGGL